MKRVLVSLADRRLLSVAAVCFAVTGASVAQDGSANPQPGIQILKVKSTRVTPPAPGWDRPIYSSSDPSDGRIATPGRFPRSTRFPRPRSPFYVYSVKIKNEGKKAITGVAWEYLVTDPADNSELSRHRFWTWEKVGSTKSKTLEGRSPSPPSNIVSVAGLQKDKRSPYLEKVILKCVMYSDGTTWTSAESTEHDCQRLKRGPYRRGRYNVR
jgi:hypothetical protein